MLSKPTVQLVFQEQQCSDWLAVRDEGGSFLHASSCCLIAGNGGGGGALDDTVEIRKTICGGWGLGR